MSSAASVRPRDRCASALYIHTHKQINEGDAAGVYTCTRRMERHQRCFYALLRPEAPRPAIILHFDSRERGRKNKKSFAEDAEVKG